MKTCNCDGESFKFVPLWAPFWKHFPKNFCVNVIRMLQQTFLQKKLRSESALSFVSVSTAEAAVSAEPRMRKKKKRSGERLNQQGDWNYPWLCQRTK